MNLIKTVRKVMSVGAGAAMVGATMSTGVLAQDLSDYPSPFIQNGQFDGLIVVGGAAQASDVLGSIDIATSLQYAARVPVVIPSDVGSSGSTRTTFAATGEVWRVGKSSESIRLSELHTKNELKTEGTSLPESIGSFGKITNEELPLLLRSGYLRVDGSSYTYTQSLEFSKLEIEQNADPSSAPEFDLDAAYSGTVRIDENEDEEFGPTLYFKSGTIANYTLEFPNNFEVEVVDNRNDQVDQITDSGSLGDLEGQEIEILGSKWSILTTESKDNGRYLELVLMGGTASDVISEGVSQQHDIEGKTYEVTAGLIFSSNNDHTIAFNVNGETTPSLGTGDTYTLNDGSVIGVRQFQVQDYLDGRRQVQYYMGANKIILRDNDIEDPSDTSELEIEDDEVDNVEVDIKGKRNIDVIDIEHITLSIQADQDLFIQEGEKLSEHLEDDKGLFNSWDVLFSGLEETSTESIEIYPSDDDQYMLKFVDGNGKDSKLPIAFAPSNGKGVDLGEKDGDAENKLVLSKSDPIFENNYFIITDDDGSYAFQLDELTFPGDLNDDLEITLENLAGGGKENLGFAVDEDALTDLSAISENTNEIFVDNEFEFDFNGETYEIDLINLDADGQNPLSDGFINVNTDGKLSLNKTHIAIKMEKRGASNEIVTETGARIEIMRDTEDKSGDGRVVVSIVSDSTDDDVPSNLDISPLIYAITDESANDVLDLRKKPLKYKTLEYKDDNDADEEYTYTAFGTYAKIDTSDSPYSVMIEYPTTQRFPAVFVTSSTATITQSQQTISASEGDRAYFDTRRIDVGVARLDSEIANIEDQNIIAVGGPCVNTVARDLLGSTSENCVEGFEPGKAMIRLFKHSNGKVGMVVAGYHAADTRKATRVLAQYMQWQNTGEFKGDSIEITQTNFNNIAVNSN